MIFFWLPVVLAILGFILVRVLREPGKPKGSDNSPIIADHANRHDHHRGGPSEEGSQMDGVDISESGDADGGGSDCGWRFRVNPVGPACPSVVKQSLAELKYPTTSIEHRTSK